MIRDNQIKPGLQFQVENSHTYIVKKISDNQMIYIVDKRHNTLFEPFEWLSVSSFVELVNHYPVKWKLLNLPTKLEYIEEL